MFNPYCIDGVFDTNRMAPDQLALHELMQSIACEESMELLNQSIIDFLEQP
jgi:hypothetical protein